jgi:VanZ family protein
MWPGSLLGFLFYGDFGHEPDLIRNPFGTTINHFIFYTYVSLLAFILYKKDKNFQKLVYGLFFLSVLLELFHLVIPNRSFQVEDLIANIFGVMFAYSVIKTYLFFNKQ